MSVNRHTGDPRFRGAGNSFIIQHSFQRLEIPSIACSSQQMNCAREERGEQRHANFFYDDDSGLFDLSSQYDAMGSSEGDPFENSAPSSPARSPPLDEKEQHPCLKPGCNKIFTHLHKLQRHYRDAHGKPQYDCPYPSCARKGPKGFARKDNMRQHHRLVHNKHLDPGEIPRRKRGCST